MKQGAALHSDLAVEESEDAVELMNGEHFSHACVVVENHAARIRSGVEVVHIGIRMPNEAGIAEDDPRLLRRSDETIPKNLIRGRDGWTGSGLGTHALRKQVGGRGKGRG